MPTSWTTKLRQIFGTASESNGRHPVVTGLPLFVLGQGRSGSTLVLRILNTMPGARICGENEKALDHLRLLHERFVSSRARTIDEFYALAWKPPCELEELEDHLRRFMLSLYNPQSQCKIWGFKEIRYGSGKYDDFVKELAFLRKLFPTARFILNTRKTEDTVNSEWWAKNPDQSRQMLENSRANFERYASENPQWSFLLPYETLKAGNPRLKELSAFVGVEHSPEFEKPLEVVLR